MAEQPSPDFRDLFHRGQLTIGISELSRMTGVSPRQLRYWQKKDTLFLKMKTNRGVRVFIP